MRPGIKARKKPKPNRRQRRGQIGDWLLKAIMNLFPATSWKTEIPLFKPLEDRPESRGLIWSNLNAINLFKDIPPVARYDDELHKPTEYYRFRHQGLNILQPHQSWDGTGPVPVFSELPLANVKPTDRIFKRFL